MNTERGKERDFNSMGRFFRLESGVGKSEKANMVKLGQDKEKIVAGVFHTTDKILKLHKWGKC